MEALNFVNLLSFGAIGLGLALAILAYVLLRSEQRQRRPRKQLMKSIYVFMGFSLFLTIAGFVAEYARSDMCSKLASSREVLTALLNVKSGKIARLKGLEPTDPAYVALVQEIQRDLDLIDQNIGDELHRSK